MSPVGRLRVKLEPSSFACNSDTYEWSIPADPYLLEIHRESYPHTDSSCRSQCTTGSAGVHSQIGTNGQVLPNLQYDTFLPCGVKCLSQNIQLNPVNHLNWTYVYEPSSACNITITTINHHFNAFHKNDMYYNIFIISMLLHVSICIVARTRYNIMYIIGIARSPVEAWLNTTIRYILLAARENYVVLHALQASESQFHPIIVLFKRIAYSSGYDTYIPMHARVARGPPGCQT
jgi:hypothetical protein